MKPVRRISKETDNQFDYKKPEGGCWWRFLEPSELDIFENKPEEYGLTNISEAQRLPCMIGKKCQKMAPSREFVSQWVSKGPKGKYLRVPLDKLGSQEYAVEPMSGYGFVLGEAMVREGILEMPPESPATSSPTKEKEADEGSIS